MAETWEWFCGVNFTSDGGGGIENTCLVDGIIAVHQFVFIIISSFVLLTLKCCSSYPSRCTSKYLLRLPGHSPRWILSAVFVVLSLAFTAEGILTHRTHLLASLPHQPHIYIPGALMTAAAVMSILYYHMLEVWQARHMVWLLVVYWLGTWVSVVVEMVNLRSRGGAQLGVARFDVAIMLIAIVSMLLFVELVLCSYLFFEQCFGISWTPDDIEDTTQDDMKYSREFSSFPSALTYSWMNWLFSLGFRKRITPEDLGNIPKVHTSTYIHEKFKNNFLEEVERSRGCNEGISLYRVYWKTFGRRWLTGGVYKICADLLNLVGPMCISGIVLYVTDSLYTDQVESVEEPQPYYVTTKEFFSNGYVLVCCIFIAALGRHTFDQTYYYVCAVEGVRVKSAIQSMVYEKSLRLSTYAMSGGLMTIGQVTNHMSVDAANIQFFFDRGNETWTVPVRITLTVVLLYLQLGLPSIIGAACLLLALPIQIKIATRYAKLTKEFMGKSDQRLKSSNEMIQGMKVLKLYGWERIFVNLIKAIRRQELGWLGSIYILIAVNFVVNTGIPIIANLLSFATYTVITGDILTPDVAFSSLSLLNALVEPMFLLPFIINLATNAHVSTRRLAFFLSGPEVEGKEVHKASLETTPASHTKKSKRDMREKRRRNRTTVMSTDDELGTSKSPLVRGNQNGGGAYGSLGASPEAPRDTLPPDVAIRIRRGHFSWDTESANPVLNDINLDIPAGKLTVVVGTVGCGKSSLLQAILGEMTTLRGYTSIKKGASIAYGPQKAWLMNASLKDNIMFGAPRNEIKYKEIVDACALAPDIAMLPGGDHTEIGEKGINLSGGQKQRVSVARTIYSSKQIVFLDDPLSALDMHVGAHLFEKGIMGILKKQKRTIILVTHQLQYLPVADKIIIMKDGRIEHQGNPRHIAQMVPSLCADWEKAIRIFSESESELSCGDSDTLSKRRRRPQMQDISEASGNDVTESILEESGSVAKQIMELSSNESQMLTDTERGRLIVKEDQEEGSVSYQVYLSYFKAMGYAMTLLMVLTVVMRAGFQIGTNFWLAIWTESSVTLNETQALADTNYYIGIYTALSWANILMRIVSISAICYGAYMATKNLHYEMLNNIVSIPMRFFDTTPTGRILNRFSTDTQYIDQRLVQTVRILINLSSQVLSSVVVIVAVSFYFISFMFPIMILFVCLLVYYIVTSRELQRNESVTRSPIFAHFSETLGGLPTIRAFQDEKTFFKIALDRILQNNKVFLYLVTAQRWVAIRLDYLGACVVVMSSLASVLGAFYLDIDASYVGLVITYSLEISMYMNLLVRGSADLELQMNAVERVSHYINVPTEDYEGIEPPDNWPENGEIKLEDVNVRYASDLDPVLKGVNLSIQKNEKLGICGRTGSGKSSLTLALFRIIDTFKGRIVIDGVDIATVPLLTLRKRLSVIPQDPFLFTGAIRLNLDPNGTKPDDELWKALEIAQIKDVVQQLDGGLDYEVTESGDNFSAGQRQLFCLARAFLRNSKIVVMDEATASIDHETDKLIQEVVADAFVDKTVLTIAHRVGTILESDKILTLEEGHVIEFDAPSALLSQETSTFASLVKAGK